MYDSYKPFSLFHRNILTYLIVSCDDALDKLEGQVWCLIVSIPDLSPVFTLT